MVVMYRLLKKKDIKSFTGRLRRIKLFIFNYNSIKKSLSLRKGECNQCGECCKFLFVCPMLYKRNSKYACRIYKIRPPICRLFPLTYHDISGLKSKCDFYWNKKDMDRITKCLQG
jgi:Fe-S-cluster containining protein